MSLTHHHCAPVPYVHNRTSGGNRVTAQADVRGSDVRLLEAPRRAAAAHVAPIATGRRGRSMRKQRIMTADFVVASIGALVAARVWTGAGASRLHDYRFIFVGGLLALPFLLANCGLYRAGLL